MPPAIVRVNRFSGLNTAVDSGRIKDSELVECQNYNLSVGGELVKRSGIKTLGTIIGGVQTVVIAFFLTRTYSQLIVRAGNDLYYTDDGGATYVSMGTWNNVEFSEQYADILYMVRRDDVMIQWNGVAMTAIPGSPSGSACRIFKDRMYVVNSYIALSNRVYYSNVADFSTAGWAGLSNFIDVKPGDGDVVVCFAILHDNFFIFKMFSTWLLYTAPDPTQWALRISSPEIGCVSRYTPHEIEGFLYFLGARGVYKTDGYFYTEVSVNVQPDFQEQVVSVATINGSMAEWWLDRYIVQLQTFTFAPTWGAYGTSTWDSLASQPWDGGNAKYTWHVYHLRANGWSHWLPAGGIRPGTMLAVMGPANMKGLYMGSRFNDGRLFRHGDPVYLDATNTPYDCVVETKEFDFDAPEYVKRSFWVSFEKGGQGVSNIANVFDSVQQPVAPLTYSDSNRRALRVLAAVFFRVWRVRVTSTQDGPQTLYGFMLAASQKKKALASV